MIETNKIRVKLKAYNKRLLTESCINIQEAVKKTEAKIIKQIKKGKMSHAGQT